MAMTIDQIVQTAKKQAAAADGDPNVIVAQMGMIPNRAALMKFSVQARTLTFDRVGAAAAGSNIFDKVKPFVKKAVCDDFGYCRKKDDVDKALNKYLPDIVKAIIKRIPISGKLPGWLAKILTFFGIAASSLDVLIALIVAWLIVAGCNALCGCPGNSGS